MFQQNYYQSSYTKKFCTTTTTIVAILFGVYLEHYFSLIVGIPYFISIMVALYEIVTRTNDKPYLAQFIATTLLVNNIAFYTKFSNYTFLVDILFGIYGVLVVQIIIFRTFNGVFNEFTKMTAFTFSLLFACIYATVPDQLFLINLSLFTFYSWWLIKN